MRIGFTTSIPVEVLLAAGHTPVDLNNLFLLNGPSERVDRAEFDGFPRNTCAWIKGLFRTALEEAIDAVIGVVEGDCSNTGSMMSLLTDRGVRVIPFGFPHQRTREALDGQISELEWEFGVTRAQTEAMRNRLASIRLKLVELDDLTWRDNRVTGLENHLWLVNASDFEGSPDNFESRLDAFLREVKARPARTDCLRLAYLGVPPIIDDLYSYVENHDARVVFNEVQRQFAMPFAATDIVDQYLQYTYPYTVNERLADIRPQLTARNIDAVIGYVQAFCHLQIDNILLKRESHLPYLVLEGDRPGHLDPRTALRLESFLEMLQSRSR
jgi:benzoyl-CoA reductase/2-hydroxyglutaryl-CoA dehydratase subunit BcrC/BadD/HgdB